MKRIVCLVLALAMLLTVASACAPVPAAQPKTIGYIQGGPEHEQSRKRKEVT